MAKEKKKKAKSREALGRGLRAILDDIESDITRVDGEEDENKDSSSHEKTEESPSTELRELGTPVEEVLVPETTGGLKSEVLISDVEVNPFQPRTEFDEDRLNELAASIKLHGVIQPITVRQLGERYQLISGERRWRASQIAGKITIPAYVRQANDQEMLELALIENIQREELNPMEIALNYRRLVDECNLLHEELAERVGKDRSTVSNYMRLLKLPPQIQKYIQSKQLSMGHARALAGIEQIEVQLSVFKQVVEQELSVRKTEELIRSLGNKSQSTSKASTQLKPEYQQIQNDLRSQLGSKVNLRVKSNGSGEMVIPFNSTDDLNRILDIIE